MYVRRIYLKFEDSVVNSRLRVVMWSINTATDLTGFAAELRLVKLEVLRILNVFEWCPMFNANSAHECNTSHSRCHIINVMIRTSQMLKYQRVEVHFVHLTNNKHWQGSSMKSTSLVRTIILQKYIDTNLKFSKFIPLSPLQKAYFLLLLVGHTLDSAKFVIPSNILNAH